MSHTATHPNASLEHGQTFRFKPNALFPSQAFLVTETDIQWKRMLRPVRRIALADIRRVRFWNISQTNVESYGLAIEGRAGSTIHLQFVDTGFRSEGPHGQAFKDASDTIIQALLAQRPDLDVIESTSLGARLALFSTGALLALFFAAVSLVCLSQGVIFEGLYALFPTAVGGIMAWNFRPWKTPPRMSLQELLEELAYI